VVTNPYPIEIPRSTSSVVGFLLGTLVFVAAGIALLLVPEGVSVFPPYLPRLGLSDDMVRDLIAWVSLLVFGGGGLFVAIRLTSLPKVAVRVTETGLTLLALGFVEIRWSDIEAIELKNGLFRRRVRMVFTDKYLENNMKRLKRWGLQVKHFDLGPTFSGVSAKRLFVILRDAHSAFQSKSV
jgi:hypothetical protein